MYNVQCTIYELQCTYKMHIIMKNVVMKPLFIIYHYIIFVYHMHYMLGIGFHIMILSAQYISYISFKRWLISLERSYLQG